MSNKQYGFETLAVHAGAAPDPATGARALPIYQTTAYAFDDADHAAALFNLQTVGFIYSRLTNPTNSALETRIASLEGGRGCTVASSGTKIPRRNRGESQRARTSASVSGTTRPSGATARTSSITPSCAGAVDAIT